MNLLRALVGILVLSIMVPTVMAQDVSTPTGWIVFEARRDNNKGDADLFRMLPDGTNQQQLTSGPNGAWNAVWSPDGEWLVYHSGTFEQKDLYRMRADGSEQQWLTTVSSLSPGEIPNCFLNEAAWSPDGEWIAFEVCVDDTVDLYRIRPDGADLQRLTADPGSEMNAVWSPDGEWIVFEGGTNLYRMRADGSEQQQLTTSSAKDWQASWSPDSQWIVFVSDRDEIGQVYRMQADGSEQQPLATIVESQSPVWSPDGEWIAFSSYQGQLYRMRTDGSNLQNLNSPGLAREVDWSPDGEWIVFDAKLTDGNMDIYRVRVDGTEQQHLTVDPGDDQHPKWSP